MKQLKITKQVTNRESISLDKYLHEISKYSLISAKRETELAIEIRKNNMQALNELIRANLRFVISVAKQYQNQGLTLSDLISEGNIGLIKAAKRFDETKGFKFISYAVWWIRQSILQSLAEHARVVRLPLNKIGSINKVNKAFYKLLQIYNREPSYDEIAKELDIAPDDVRKAMMNSEKHISMDEPMYDDNKRNMYHMIINKNTLSPEKNLLKESLIQELKRVLNTLPKRECEILRMSFGLDLPHPYTLEEIGRNFNLTRERVRQIKSRSLKKLKHRSTTLQKYL